MNSLEIKWIDEIVLGEPLMLVGGILGCKKMVECTIYVVLLT